MKLIPDDPAQNADERARWAEGVRMLGRINEQRAQTGEEPLTVNKEAAPDAVKEAEAARLRELEDLAEASRLQGRAERETEYLRQQIQDLGGEAA